MIFKNKCCHECLDRYNFKKMDCQNHQFFGDFNAVQLYLHFEHKMVLLKLSEGHCSIVIMVNILKLYCYCIEITHRSVLQESVTLLSGFYG